MITYLEGTINAHEHHGVVLLVNHVGYLIYTPLRTRSRFPVGEQAAFWVHQATRDNADELYGFETRQELELFRTLISVSGVGPKSALGVLETNIENIIEAIRHANLDILLQAPRLGKKTAQKIIIELQPKLGALEELSFDTTNSQYTEAVRALVEMGYDRRAVYAALRSLPADLTELQDVIKFVLRSL